MLIFVYQLFVPDQTAFIQITCCTKVAFELLVGEIMLVFMNLDFTDRRCRKRTESTRIHGSVYVQKES